MGLILDMSPRALEKILHFANYVVLDAKDTDLYVKKLSLFTKPNDSKSESVNSLPVFK